MTAITVRTKRISLPMVSLSTSREPSLRIGGDALARREDVHALRSFDRVEAHYGGLAAEFDCRNDRIQFGGVEIALELLARIPIFDEQKGLASVEIRIQAGLQTAGRDSRWAEHGRKRAQ